MWINFHYQLHKLSTKRESNIRKHTHTHGGAMDMAEVCYGNGPSCVLGELMLSFAYGDCRPFEYNHNNDYYDGGDDDDEEVAARSQDRTLVGRCVIYRDRERESQSTHIRVGDSNFNSH